MFTLMKQVFIALLSFSRSLATKCISLKMNHKQWIRPTLFDLSPKILDLISSLSIYDYFR